MPRINLDSNPALGADATNWSGGTRVTVSGFPRPDAYRGSGSNFAHTVTGLTANPLLVSFYHDLTITSSKVTINWNSASGSWINYVDLTPGAAAATGGRFTAIVTPPANTAQAELQFKSFPSGTNVTAVLIEHRSDVAPYGDGESAGWVWDGARYNSTSTEVGVVARTSNYFHVLMG